ncbi:MAG: hypothetical protein DWQ07_20155 [Chloroflexi bacterium]|nr:MAG: hypothetical protein DWQ07_20155 [Chloroflexota bacterium]MBL1194395.1 hypothetical protein [Chloroflexota bacterium]NOH11683.1 hypothetical protein [Chloroflexota bacterium]
MSEINKMNPSEDAQDQMLEQLRSRALEEMETAPVVEGHDSAPKEMRTRNTKMIVRGLIALLTVLVMVEGVVIFQVQSTPVPADFETNVPVTVQQAPDPVVFEAPPVEGAEPLVISGDPAEFSAPLPEDLNGDIASGEVAPLPAEFPPLDSEDEAEGDN